jgi:hypothetical protein
MPFALTTEPTQSEVSDAVNYLLANFSPNLSADTGTGQIKGPVGEITGYLYKYMAVKYADSYEGSLNFSNTPTDRLYYGLRNSNDASESNNPADYVWYRATGGFGTLKFLFYIATGGRQIQFAVATTAPDTGWVQDGGGSIDLDVVTSGNIPVITEQFLPYFTPAILQVPRSGSPLTPSFTGIRPTMYATDKGTVVPFTDAQTDSNVAFVNSSWRIGNSSTTGYGDISLTNITIGNPTDGGDYALWPTPTAMSSSPAYITVPVRYKNSTGVVTQAGIATIQLLFTDPGAAGSNGPAIDISGYTTFVQNAGGAFNPPNATLSATYANVTSPSFSWSISGATPTSSTASSVVVTPLSSATSVLVTLTVNGSNLSSPISKTINMPILYDGAPGEAGSNGLMSAFPTIYQWTGSSTPPTRPTTTSTYTWGTASFTAPSGWYSAAPSNTTAGNYLWSITIPLNTTATTTTSTLDWTNTLYPIRAIAYNGANGGTGDPGAPGAAGAATFVVTRFANDSSAPTNAEVYAVIGRNPVAGDIVTVSYNNYNNATVYRFVTSWILFTTYITGSLIVQNTITADKMVTGLMSADNVLTRGLTVRDNSGNILLAAGTPLNYSNITASSGWLNSNISISSGAISGIGTGNGTPVANSLISINSNGTLSGAGGGSVSLGGLGAGGFAYLNQITSANATTYIAGAAIGTAQVGVLSAGNIGANTIDASKIAANTITAGQIASNTITSTQIAANTITAGQIAANTITAGQIAANTITAGQIAANTITAGQIAANTITAAQIASNTITATNIDSRNLTLKDASGNIIFGSGATVNASSYLVPSSGWLNSNISIGSNGVLSGAGGGTVTATGINAVATDLSNAPAGILNSNVTLGTLGAGGFAYLNQITSANATTYIAGAAIGTAQVGVLTAGNIGAGTIDASKIAANTITAGQIASGTITATQIASSTITATQIAGSTITADKLSVSNLSAISANLGTVTAGSISGTSLSVGSSPAVSGTSMTGAGAIINTDGTFALGNGSTNISYNGSQMSLNGNVVATANINTNAVTNSNSALGGTVSGNDWTTGTQITFYTSGNPVYIATNGADAFPKYSSGDSDWIVYANFRLVRDSTILIGTNNSASMGYRETLSAGSYTYYLQFKKDDARSGGSGDAVMNYPSIFVIETKR